MRRILPLICGVLLCAAATAAPRFSLSYSPDWKKVTGVHGVKELALDIANNDPHCDVKFFKGKVIDYKDYGDYFQVNVNNAFLNRTKDHLLISAESEKTFENSDRKRITELLNYKSDLIFSTYMCGSGGVMYIDSIVKVKDLIQ